MKITIDAGDGPMQIASVLIPLHTRECWTDVPTICVCGVNDVITMYERRIIRILIEHGVTPDITYQLE